MKKTLVIAAILFAACAHTAPDVAEPAACAPNEPVVTPASPSSSSFSGRCSAASPFNSCPPDSAYYGSREGRVGCFDAAWKWLGPSAIDPCP
jgi:hypothetical protein